MSKTCKRCGNPIKPDGNYECICEWCADLLAEQGKLDDWTPCEEEAPYQ